MRICRTALAAVACALIATSALAIPFPSPRPFDAPVQGVPFAVEVETTQFRLAPLSQTAQPEATQVQAVTPAAPTPPTNTVPGTTVTTTGSVDSSTKISVGSWMGDILQAVITLFTTTIGAALTVLLVKLLNGVGANINAARQEQLQKLIERGLTFAAAGAKKTLDGKISVDVKSKVVADAIKYAQVHGAGLIKALGETPGSAKTEEALEARAEAALADPSVPVEVSEAPAAPTSVAAAPSQDLVAALKIALGQIKLEAANPAPAAPKV